MGPARESREPESIPLPGDADMSGEGRVTKRGPDSTEGPGSPQRKSRPQQIVVDLDTLRALMTEQTQGMLEQQRACMKEMMKQLRDEMQQGDDEVKQILKEQAEGIHELKTQKDEILDRLKKLEDARGSASNASTAEGDGGWDRHKTTLVFGGWDRETRKALIIDDAHQALIKNDLARFTDFPVWTTGPRRSMCLLNFKARGGEGYSDVRDRMQRVLDGIMASGTVLRSGKKMWCGHSRPREERARGDHAAHVRRVVRQVRPDQENSLEVEYSTGSSWIGERKLSSAVLPPDERAKAGVHRRGGAEQGAWMDVVALAEVLNTKEDVVREAIVAQQR